MYAVSLLEFAEERNLELIYQQALSHLSRPERAILEPLASFMGLIPQTEATAVLNRFLKLAENRIDFLEVEIISAVLLSYEQQEAIQEKLVGVYGRPLAVTTTVDPQLLGGLRVTVGNTVIDASIKRKLFDMKTSMIEGVRSYDA